MDTMLTPFSLTRRCQATSASNAMAGSVICRAARCLIGSNKPGPTELRPGHVLMAMIHWRMIRAAAGIAEFGALGDLAQISSARLIISQKLLTHVRRCGIS